MTAVVKTPASSANLGPGFDVLGLALTLYDTISLVPGRAGLTLTVSGEGRGKLDRSPEGNLAVRAVKAVYAEIGAEPPAIDIHMDNAIPLSRGLGSSAAAIVGALTAASAFSGADLNRDRLFALAVELEGHADNVAAAVYGGLTISFKQGDTFNVRRSLPAANIGVALLLPEAGLSTAKARAALPEETPRANAVFNIGRTALLVEALLSGDLDCLAAAVEDALHQPWRRGLIPDYNVTEYACYQAGARGVALSGAGPSLIAFYDKKDETAFKAALAKEVESAGIQRLAIWPDIDVDGAVVATCLEARPKTPWAGQN
ncbi:MAG: homoserine kinase [Actinomycetota bacterium]|nr:homoserine kinase [Actinomycetota bacterium]